MLQYEGFGPLISENLHYGWRKFFTFVVWNAPEWRVWTAYLRISSPWLKKIFDFRGLECSRMEDWTAYLRIYLLRLKNWLFLYNKQPAVHPTDRKKILLNILPNLMEKSLLLISFCLPSYFIESVQIRKKIE